VEGVACALSGESPDSLGECVVLAAVVYWPGPGGPLRARTSVTVLEREGRLSGESISVKPDTIEKWQRPVASFC
jgi:hypothetical protein